MTAKHDDEDECLLVAYIQGRQDAGDWYRTRITELGSDNKGLRTLLFLRHGCGFDALYGDDGELQCSSCGIDFKRMSADEISERFMAIGIAKAAADKEI